MNTTTHYDKHQNKVIDLVIHARKTNQLRPGRLRVPSYLAIVGTLIAFLSFAGCKVRITAPEGGDVVTESGNYQCLSGKTCTLEVVDFLFDETFIVRPLWGYNFEFWRKGPYSLCGWGQKPCRVRSTGSGNNTALAELIGSILRSDEIFDLEPVVAPVDSRFAGLLDSPHLHAHLAMNSAEAVCYYTRPCANKGMENPVVSYDPEENAFLVTMGTMGISSSWQIRKYFNRITRFNSNSVSFQWEFKYGEAFLSTGSLQNFKAFQLSDTTENLMFEMQHRFSTTDDTAVALPTIRYYPGTAYTEAHDNEPLSSWGPPISTITGTKIDNWQPGGDTAAAYRDNKIRKYSASDHLNDEVFFKPYIIRANLWTRVTFEFEWAPSPSPDIHQELRLRVWMSDEETPPTLVIASVNEPGKGFLLSRDASKRSMSFQNWWLELNSSQDGVFPNGPGQVWVKNFIVYKDASIPLD